MNELIKAAKAVIDWFDEVTPSDMPIEELRAAVERAEKQESIRFDEWWRKQDMYHCSKAFAITIWTAAQQAERMRIKDLLKQSSDWFEDGQMAQANWLLEKIDATTE